MRPLVAFRRRVARSLDGKHVLRLGVLTGIAADWLFLIGSILFAAKLTIDVVRSAHLKRLPKQSDEPLHHSRVRPARCRAGRPDARIIMGVG